VRSHGGLFICDEVQTGLGRTGRTWGVDEHGVEPDIVTVAKGIANGYPISAVLSTAAIAQSWRAANVATFGGNPIACAAASATIDTVLDENLVENASAMGALLRDGLEALKARHGIIGDVRGRGLMQGVEIVSDEPAGDRTPNVAATLQLFEETKRRGLLVGRGGLHGNVLRVAPPLIVARGEVAEALQILEESLVAVATRRASPAVTCA
jgi:4-aminobutyrate aminotransferase-like enzyme